MSLSVFETAAVLSSFYIAVWSYFTLSYWLDARTERRKAKAAWKKLSFTSKTKRVGGKIAKTKTAKAVSKGAKQVGNVVSAPVISAAKAAAGAANNAANVAEKTIDVAAQAAQIVGGHAQKACETIADAAKATSVQKSVKGALSKAKSVGSKVKGFFELKPLEDEPNEDKSEDD